MARMRSLKPEFWHDRKLARSCSRDARMLYMGLWNQADEHGRANGDEAVIKGQVFPFDDDVQIGPLLDELETAGRVVLYEFDGDPYLFLPKLGKHQRLEPLKVPSRLPEVPEPDQISTSEPISERRADKLAPDANSSETIVAKHVACSREHVAGGMEHVGETRTAQTLIAEWMDHCDAKPPSAVKGQIARLVGQLLAEGQPYDLVRRGLAAWNDKRLHPSTLPSIVFEMAQAPRGQPNKATQRLQTNLALIARLEAEGP